MNLKEKTEVIDNKIYHYSKIVMLPTNAKTKEGDYCMLLGESGKLYAPQAYTSSFKPQHLYFISPDKICEGDWIYTDVFKEEIKKVEDVQDEIWLKNNKHSWFKIISSTNLECNLHKPSEAFIKSYIEAYNKNEKIENCLVLYEEQDLGLLTINPNCWDEHKVKQKGSFIPKITKREITIKKVKESWSKDELQIFNNSNNCNHLRFIYNRLVHVHNENPNFDYMLKLNDICNFIEENL